MQRTALVTGGNRGIGLEVCRQLGSRGLRVILTARDRGQGQEAADELKSRGLDVRFVELDLSSDASVARCATHLASKEIEVDVLVNNAGVYPPGTALTAPLEAFDEGWQVHVLGTLRMARAFVPAMIRRCYGRVVNLSSGYGSLLSVEAGADSVVWLATLPSNGPHGGFFRKRRRIPW